MDPTPPAAAPAIDPLLETARRAALAAVLALIALGLAWELWLAPTGRGTLAIKVLPLVLCVPGLLRHRLYTFRWLSLLLWLYVLEGLTRGYAERGWSQALAIGEVGLALALFGACGMYVRRHLHLGRLARDAAQQPGERAAPAAP